VSSPTIIFYKCNLQHGYPKLAKDILFTQKDSCDVGRDGRREEA